MPEQETAQSIFSDSWLSDAADWEHHFSSVCGSSWWSTRFGVHLYAAFWNRHPWKL